MTHTFSHDLDIIVVGPTGIAVYLMSDVGGQNDLVNTNYTFQDSFALMSETGVNASGNYAPTNFVFESLPAPAPAGPYGTELSAFNGTSPNGVWSLYVYDDAGGDSGTMAGGWELQFNGSSIPALELTSAVSRKTHSPFVIYNIGLPKGVAVDGLLNVYVGDTGNETIRKITAGGVVTTLAGLAGNSGSANGAGTSCGSVILGARRCIALAGGPLDIRLPSSRKSC